MAAPLTIETNPRHEPPVPCTALPEDRAHTLAAQLAEGLARAWRRGQRLRAEDLLGENGYLTDHPQSAWLVILEEIRQRRAAGLTPTREDFLHRFPLWATQIYQAFAEGNPANVPQCPRFPENGETLAGCRIVATLGRGSGGTVFLAVQDDLAGRPVVLKVTRCVSHEHLSLARLLHSHIVPLYFVQDFPERDLRVMAMPYMGGASLGEVLDKLSFISIKDRTGADVLHALDVSQSGLPLQVPSSGPFRPMWERSSYPEALGWVGVHLAEAMHYAHERGLVHLDLKPDNILLAGDGQPLLLDFHLSRAGAGGRPFPRLVRRYARLHGL